MLIKLSRIFLLLLTAAALLSAFGCNKAKKAYLPIKWDYVVGLPEGFPRLCEALTTASDAKGDEGTTVSLVWNILDKKDFDAYLKKIEAWANASFIEANGSYRLEASIGGTTVKAEAAYNEKASGDHVEGSLYDSQARITVVS